MSETPLNVLGGALLFAGDRLPDWVVADLRTDHAGSQGGLRNDPGRGDFCRTL